MLQHFPKVSPNLRLKPPNRNAEADTERFYQIKSTGDVKQSLYCGLLYVSAYGMQQAQNSAPSLAEAPQPFATVEDWWLNLPQLSECICVEDQQIALCCKLPHPRKNKSGAKNIVEQRAKMGRKPVV
jgi:hypothetical protein